MPNLDEKAAFEHGCHICITLLEGVANEAERLGRKDHAEFLRGALFNMPLIVATISRSYAENGYEATLKRAEAAAYPGEPSA